MFMFGKFGYINIKNLFTTKSGKALKQDPFQMSLIAVDSFEIH